MNNNNTPEKKTEAKRPRIKRPVASTESTCKRLYERSNMIMGEPHKRKTK